MPISNEVENKQRTERKGKIRDVIKQAVTASKPKVKDEKGDLFVKATEKPNKPIELEDSPKNIKGKTQHWGYHLLLDISDCNKNIDDEKAIEDFLKTLVKEIKMKPIGKPIIVRVDSKKEGRGVSACQFIESSTLIFHGDDDGYNAYIDVFSCAPFDPKVAIKCVKKYFEPRHVGDLFIHRDAGNWPKSKDEL